MPSVDPISPSSIGYSSPSLTSATYSVSRSNAGILGANVLISSNSEICIGSSTGDLTLINYIGTITDWGKRLDGEVWQSIGHTEETYSEIPTEDGTWEYRVEIDGANYSSIASVIVSQNPDSEYIYTENNQEITKIAL